MRNIAAAVVFACLIPLAAGTTACSYLGTEQLAPRSARAAYAEAEVLFTGSISVIEILADRGALTNAQVAALLPTLDKARTTLDKAYELLKAGDAVAALAKVDLAHADLAGLAETLNRVADAIKPAAVTPPPVPAPAAWKV